MKANPLIKAKGVYRYFGSFCAVSDFNLDLREGEVLGLLGPNGAGKTSTLKMLSGNLAVSSGAISIKGYDLKEHPRQAKMLMGYLPEQPPLYRDLTVNEYLRYCARLRLIESDKLESAVDEAKRRCGLAEVGGRLIGNLSKGYQQRVGIAQAIVHEPAVLILDEPTVGLDPIQIRDIRALIRELGASHGVILSTHLLPEVEAICDRVMIIHRGRSLFDDKLEGLAGRHTRPVLRIRLSRPPRPESLADMEGVEEIQVLGEGEYRIAFEEGAMDPARVAEVAAHMRWGLTELRTEFASLEQIFVNFIFRDTAEIARKAAEDEDSETGNTKDVDDGYDEDDAEDDRPEDSEPDDAGSRERSS